MRTLLAIALVIGSVTQARAEGDDDKSPGAALGLSLGGTIASAGLIGLAFELHPGNPNNVLVASGVAGIALMPSAGHVYAHDYLSTGLLIRAGGVAGAALLYSITPCHRGDSPTDPCTDASSGQKLAVFAGAAMFLVGVAWDIKTAPAAADRDNERLSVALVPVVSHGSYGVGLAGSF